MNIPKLPDNHYQCSCCGGIFEQEDDWTTEDAIAEKDQNFPGIPIEECKIVCEDCYTKIMKGLKNATN